MARDKDPVCISGNNNSTRQVTKYILYQGKQSTKSAMSPALGYAMVHLGDAIVTNRNGKAYIQVINTSDTDRELIIPSIKLQEIDQMSAEEPSASGKNFVINTFQAQHKSERDKQIQGLLRLGRGSLPLTDWIRLKSPITYKEWSREIVTCFNYRMKN